MDVEEIWQQADWASQSRDIINKLNEFPTNSKIILVLRHSHRNEPKPKEDMREIRLTPQGHAIAKKFGESLPINRPIRLFHSYIMRCQETAENIQNGFKSVGGDSQLVGKFIPLYHLGINNRAILANLKNFNFKGLIYRWAVGFYSSKDWEPLASYCQNAAHLISKHLKDVPENGINIYVTHDWHLMSLRFGWFGLPPDSQWVKFLGGFAFTFKEDHFLLLERGELKSVEAPHWWKSDF